ncbi:MarR family winged helix-turn-helix transcriptional regulator [Lysinimonas soli]|uniref:MarR family winged helix-turn-helix transcriptional regulator n=1 Tax=Lysinimonas soli TaxID=1074233 RepID=A0ABW0NQE3_9MICO
MAEHLSDAGNRAWRALASVTHLLGAELERQTQRDAGMPHVYYVLLAALYEAPGRRLRAGALAEAARISPSRLSHAVRSMEESGWVTRERAAGDGRGQQIVLSEAGVTAVRRLAPLQQANVRVPLLGDLDDERLTRLAELLEPLAARLESAR